ncbi:MAG: site-specific integrase, partial [Halobacteriaceae archaeon]
REVLSELQQKEEWDNSDRWKNLRAEDREKVIQQSDFCTEDNLIKIVYEDQWQPKYDRSARTIPFGWSYRLTACLMTFFDKNESVDCSRQKINSLIKEAAENSETIDP